MKKTYSNFLKTSDGEQIFYVKNFQETPKDKDILVFNYGLVCSHHHWQKQIDFFDELNFPILLHDYRGHYQSSGAHDLSNLTFNRMTIDLYELLQELEIKQVCLLGHSMGVNICLEFAKLYPKIVSSMVLISGTILPVHDVMMNSHLTGPIKPIILNLIEKFPNEFNLLWKYGGWNPLIKKLIHTGGFNVDFVDEEFIEIYLNKIAQLGPHLFFQLIDQMQEHDILPFTEKITKPALVIGGNKDKVIPNFLQRFIHERLKNSQLYIIHEGSHVPQVDFPELTNERIKFFLENLKTK
ncbi:MAG: alpha/beta hydrolase [Bacteriovoracaceae bacterium]|jgi:pimeloyl-ACP methyl ester carboxylesterase|nr:alpha/beta hydrolase [Bacteriovoracaceae bacterium]